MSAILPLRLIIQGPYRRTVLVGAVAAVLIIVPYSRFVRVHEADEAILRLDHDLGVTLEEMGTASGEALYADDDLSGRIIVTSTSEHQTGVVPPLQVGDIIEDIDGADIASRSDLAAAGEHLIKARTALLSVNRHGKQFTALVLLKP
jgi:hypothetical protein